MSRVLFSIHVGDSIAHVLRTRELAKYLYSKKHEIGFSIPQKASVFLMGYVSNNSIFLMIKTIHLPGLLHSPINLTTFSNTPTGKPKFAINFTPM